LSEEKQLANYIMMLAVGHSSTVNLIGVALLSLLRHPAQWRLLAQEPSRIDAAIAEVLRYESPVPGVSRTALSDVALTDKTIRRGEKVICLIGVVNRDPARFPEPDRFDIGRRPNPHLSFGYGIHTCIGKSLAQLATRIVVGNIGALLTGNVPGHGRPGVGGELSRTRAQIPASDPLTRPRRPQHPSWGVAHHII